MSTKELIGTAARPRRSSRLGDTCPRCKGGNLWASYFTPEGDGSDGNASGDRWLTLCPDCGTFYA